MSNFSRIFEIARCRRHKSQSCDNVFTNPLIGNQFQPPCLGNDSHQWELTESVPSVVFRPSAF